MKKIVITLKSKQLSYKIDEVWFLQYVNQQFINKYTAEEFYHHYLQDDKMTKYLVDTALFATFEIPETFSHHEILEVNILNVF